MLRDPPFKRMWYVSIVYVVVQFYPWFEFYFLLFRGMVMYDNEFETKENNISTSNIYVRWKKVYDPGLPPSSLIKFRIVST